jgi:membrane protease YdiL (CAAX protease family)
MTDRHSRASEPASSSSRTPPISPGPAPAGPGGAGPAESPRGTPPRAAEPLPAGSLPVGAEQADAAPAPLPAELAYHRLSRADPRHRWWKPLVEIVISAPLFVVVSVVLGLLIGMVALLPGGPELSLEATSSGYPVEIFSQPLVFFITFFSIVIMLPCVLLARMAMGPAPLGLICSVAGRLRWGWLGLCLLVGFGLYAVVQGLLIGVPLAAGAPAPETSFDPAVGLWILALTLVLVPVQCAAEEFAFRGYLMQSIGRWLRHPAWAIVLPVPIFVIGHGYDPWGQASVGAMALVAGYLCYRTGGLEAAIGLHVSNNVIGLLLGAIGWADPFASEGGSPFDLVVALILDLGYAALIVLLARRRGVQTRRRVLLPAGARP